MTAATQLTPEMNGAAIYQWLLTGTNSGDAIDLFGYGDKTICLQSAGAYGATVTIEGSIDGITYAPLTDADGNTVSASTGIKQVSVREAVRYYRASNGGTLSATVKVLIFAKGC